MKHIARILIVIFTVTIATTSSYGMSDKGLVSKYCKNHYKGYKVEYFRTENWNVEKILNRKGEKVVYVEKCVSWSDGTNKGYDNDGYVIYYNRKVKKNKKVVSYLIYNPETNAIDDVVAIVDNKMLR